MKELSWDYDISVERILNIDQKLQGYEITEATFMNNKEQYEKRNVLGDQKGNQIFKMRDGKYILESENEEMEVDYFYSMDINDLLKK
jgi:hypothetical protein